MTQTDLVELAQQGDSLAIAALLNRTLQPRGVSVQVQRQENCLHILLQSTRWLNPQNFVKFLHDELSRIHPQGIERVKLYALQPDEPSPSWQLEFILVAAIAPVVPGTLARPRPKSTDFLDTLRTFQFAAVFPYREVFSRELYQSPIVKLLLFFGLFPLAVDLISNPDTVAQTAWLLGIYYASIWGLVLYDLIKPLHFSWGNVLKCALFTTLIGIPLLLLVQRVPPFTALYSAIHQGFPLRIVGFILGVGLLEETCKGLPVYILLSRSPHGRDPLNSAFYGAMSGLGFAIAEGVAYSFLYRFGLDEGYLGLNEYIVINTIRFVSLPLFHAILAGIVGYFIGLAAINPSRQGAILFIGLAIAAVLHGLYNSFAGHALGLVIIGFSILLFVTYLRRSRQMVIEMRQAEQQGLD